MRTLNAPGGILLAAVVLLGLAPAAWPDEPAGPQPDPIVAPPPTPPAGITPEAPPAPPQPLSPGTPDTGALPTPVPSAEMAGPSALGASPFLNPVVGQAPPLRATYRATWYPDEPVAGQPTHLGYVEQDFSLSVPIWQEGCDEWTATAHVRGELFQTHAVLPDSRRAFPDELWDLRFGTTYRHQFDNGWIAGGSANVGSASDRPFHSIEEMTAGVNAFLRVPSGDHNAWLFTLAYSATSELPIPLPGVAYYWQPSERFHANIGLPFQLWYRPVDDLTLDFSYMLLRTVHARATYRLLPPVRVYAGFDWSNESYFLADRVNNNDRFFYYDQRLTTGVQVFVNKHTSLDFSGGYVFDRYYFQGQHLSDSQHDRIDVGAGPFLSFQCLFLW